MSILALSGPLSTLPRPVSIDLTRPTERWLALAWEPAADYRPTADESYRPAEGDELARLALVAVDEQAREVARVERRAAIKASRDEIMSRWSTGPYCPEEAVECLGEREAIRMAMMFDR